MAVVGLCKRWGWLGQRVENEKSGMPLSRPLCSRGRLSQSSWHEAVGPLPALDPSSCVAHLKLMGRSALPPSQRQVRQRRPPQPFRQRARGRRL